MERINIAEQRIRSFIAIKLPHQLRSAIAELAMPLQKLSLDVKWVPENNYHLTLKFLGPIAPDDIPVLDAHLQALASRDNFMLSAGHWGMFPGLKRPNVLWMGIGGDLDALQRLWGELDDRLFGSGYPRDPRFHPHITLGRFRSSANADRLITKLQQTPALDHIGSFPAASLHLMESQLSPAGPSYRALSSYEFRVNK